MTAMTAPLTRPPAAPARPRIDALDVLRGFALCGILLVNIEPVTRFRYETPPPHPISLPDPSGWLQLLVQQRFFPIFSLLFGIGFSLLLASAADRDRHPRVVLLRRLLVLLPVGLVHQLWHPGEALAFYAVFGLVVLLPSSWLPRWAVAGLAGVLIVASLVLAGGGVALIPGLFLLGSTLVRFGVVARMGRSAAVPAGLALLLAVAAVPALLAQLDDLPQSGFDTASAVAGLLLAGVYVCVLLVLLRTPLRALLHALFAPLGRMALTNYLTATVAMVVAGHLLDLPHSTSWGTVFAVAGAVLVVQWIFSTLWLRRFRQGPLEWLWRWATWLRRPPLRRT
jgi:uncharacterized protein